MGGSVRRVQAWVAALCVLALMPALGPSASAQPVGQGKSVVLLTAYDGAARRADLYVPARVPQQRAVPLLMVLHGLYLDPGSAEASSGLDQVADAEGVAVAYPQGLNQSWNAGTCCDTASRDDVDDVGFLAHVVDLVNNVQAIDRDRVYVAGFSNGGMMALRAVCARPDVFAAAASVGGTLQSGCLSAAPSSALLVHGLRDTTVPYAGTRYSQFLRTALTPVPRAGLLLARHAGCLAVRRESESLLVTDEYRGCAPGARVSVVTVPGLGHRWPNARIDGVDGQALVWDFLSGQRRTA